MNQNERDLEVWTAGEAAAFLRVSSSTVKRLVAAGRLHRSAISVGRRLFVATEVRKLANTPLTSFEKRNR